MQVAVVIVVVFLAAVLVLRHLIRKTGDNREPACGCATCQWSASCGREQGEGASPGKGGIQPQDEASCQGGDAD